MTDFDEAIKRVDDENKRQNERLRSLENALEKLADISVSIGTLTQSVEYIAEELSKQNARLAVIEQLPAKRWETIVLSIITAVMAFLIGHFVG